MYSKHVATITTIETLCTSCLVTLDLCGKKENAPKPPNYSPTHVKYHQLEPHMALIGGTLGGRSWLEPAQKPYILWSLGLKALTYESFAPQALKWPCFWTNPKGPSTKVHGIYPKSSFPFLIETLNTLYYGHWTLRAFGPRSIIPAGYVVRLWSASEEPAFKFDDS